MLGGGLCALGLGEFSRVLEAQQGRGVTPGILEGLAFRNIGPAIMGGRIGAVEGVTGDPRVIYVGTAAGGIFKTSTAGVTWEPIFDDQGTHSIGAIAVAASDSNVVYVGTGEASPRNSVSIGDGVYRSTNGGKTWTHVGLRDTQTIARLRVHPSDASTVLVAAMGHNWGPNEQRGIFRTTDGGQSWQKVLYVNQDTGASDVDIDYSNPRFVYAGMYDFRRTPYSFTSGGPGSGIYRSTDAGVTFQKVTKGLPTGLMGRTAVAAAPNSPGVVYAMVESKQGVLYRSDDYGESWTLISKDPTINDRPFYYTDLRVDPNDSNRLYSVAGNLKLSTDGGRTWETIGQSIHGDHQALWIDPADSRRVLNGNDGGFAISYDGARTWDYVTQFAIAQFYHVNVSMTKPYLVGGGLQDNGNWIGPARTRHRAGILNSDWRRVYGGDGFYVVWQDDNTVYTNSQRGNLARVDTRTGETKRVEPYPVPISGGGAGDHPYRFNWNAPVAISTHNREVIYFGGNVLWKTSDRGQTWTTISPDLTTNDRSKLGPSGGPISPENTGAESYCTITAIAESPITPGLIWVGTDDGNVQLTRDGGKNWTNVIGNAKGLPPESYVSMIEPSRFDAGTAYVAFDRHRSSDMKPYVFKTTDHGRTWRSITANLPQFGYAWVIREDPKNRNLLYAGTEFGFYLSFDGGGGWLRYPGLPTMPVNDLVIHPRENDLILATHGRGLFILDDLAALQGLSNEVLTSEGHLFDIRPATRFVPWSHAAVLGQKVFQAPNPPYGALITYYLKAEVRDEPLITVVDRSGATIRQLRGSRSAGINRIAWDLRYDDARWQPEGEQTASRRFSARAGPLVLPGEYSIKLKISERELTRTVRVELDSEVKVAQADLEKQLQSLLRLRDMISTLNQVIGRIGTLQKQVDQAIDRIKRASATTSTTDKNGGSVSTQVTGSITRELVREFETLGRRLTDQRERLLLEGLGHIHLAKPAKLRDKIISLAASIGEAAAAPTAAELEYLEKHATEVEKELNEFNDLVSRTIPAMNEKLRNADIPYVVAVERSSVERLGLVRSEAPPVCGVWGLVRSSGGCPLRVRSFN